LTWVTKKKLQHSELSCRSIMLNACGCDPAG